MTRLWRLVAISLSLLLLCLPLDAVAGTGEAAPSYQHYAINVSAMQNALGIGSVDPSRAIQQSLTMLGWGASSSTQYINSGTTTATDCTNGNIITATTSCSPNGCSKIASYSTCNNGANWRITLHNPTDISSLYTWVNLNHYSVAYNVAPDGGSYSANGNYLMNTANDSKIEISQAVLRELIIARGAFSGDPTCLSYPATGKALNRLLAWSRNTLCEGEIEQLNGSHVAEKVWMIHSTDAGWTAPSSGTWMPPEQIASSDSNGAINYGLGFAQHTRGWVLAGGVEHYREGFPRAKISSSNHDVKFHDPGWTGEYNLPSAAVSVRRPAMVWDPTRETWYMFVSTKSTGDKVEIWSSPDRVTWTYKGRIMYWVQTGLSWTHREPLTTRWPVSVTYDTTSDQLIVLYHKNLWFNHSEESGPCTQSGCSDNTTKHNSSRSNLDLCIVTVPAGNVAENQWRAPGSFNGIPGQGEACSYMLSTFSYKGSGIPNEGAISTGPTGIVCGESHCTIMASDITDSRPLVAMSSKAGGDGTAGMYGFQAVGGASDWPPGITWGHKLVTAVLGTDYNLYINSRFESSTTTWTGWSGVSSLAWTQPGGSPSFVLFTHTGPSIVSRFAKHGSPIQNYQIIIGGARSCTAGCSIGP